VTTMAIARAACPECGRKINLKPDVKKGDWVACPHCKAADIEVISLDPPLLNWAYEEPEIAGYPQPWRRWWW
jgi:lysine biosynthesis protein LysW